MNRPRLTAEQESQLRREILALPPVKSPGRGKLIRALAERWGLVQGDIYNRLTSMSQEREPYQSPRSAAYIHPGSDLTDVEVEFGVAMERWSRRTGKRYPDCREVLQVAAKLGYKRAGGV